MTIDEFHAIEDYLNERGLLNLAHECSRFYNVALMDLFERRKFAPICMARGLFYAALRKRGWSYPMIAKLMNMDHTSIMSASKKVDTDDVITVERNCGAHDFVDSIIGSRL